MRECMCVFVTYIHTHAHTHTHTYTYTCSYTRAHTHIHTHTQVRQDNGKWLKGELVGRPKKLKYTIAFGTKGDLEPLQLGSASPPTPPITLNPDP